VTVLLGVGLAVVIFGAVILLFIPNRPGGTITLPGKVEVSSKGAGLPLIVVGIATVAYSATPNDDPGPSPTTSAAESLIFQDDFSTTGERRWDDNVEAEGTGGQYEDGAYHISVERVAGLSAVLATAAPQSPPEDNVRITVDAQRVGGNATEGYGYGVFCRSDGQGNLYAFTIWANHSTITKRAGGQGEHLSTNATVSGASVGDEEKKLQAVCTSRGGSAVDLEFFVDDEMIMSFTDENDPYQTGHFGLDTRLSQGHGNPEDTLEVAFDDFVVTKTAETASPP
jgi:hypothetical protein